MLYNINEIYMAIFDRISRRLKSKKIESNIPSVTEKDYNILIKELMRKKINIQVHKTDIKTVYGGDTCIYKFGYLGDLNDGIPREQAAMFFAINNFDAQERELVRKIVDYMFQ